MFFAPQDKNNSRIRCFLVQSLSFSAGRRKGGTALHTHPLAGKFVSEHTGTSYRLLNAGSTFYPYLVRLSVKESVVRNPSLGLLALCNRIAGFPMTSLNFKLQN